MNSRMQRAAPLLFGSGLCALIYQTVWLRELRLVFGASTPASAAVLGIFMGGLGLGGLLLGPRAEKSAHPLRFYANLEALVALSAATTPGLLWLIRHAYVALGGSLALGAGLGTVTRLLLTAMVLLVPTVLMGGTLPAACKAVEDDSDVGRHLMAILYGANTVGAVVGTSLSTFVLLEIYGARQTLWMACLVNGAVAVIARVSARTMSEVPRVVTVPAPEPSPARVSPTFVLAAAAIVGFVFMLMELVWYRMLGPLLGGSTYTFGLILALALLGIGLGGISYAVWGRRRAATLGAFAVTCTVEAAFIALPLALGDRIALFALLLRPLAATTFTGALMGWTAVASLVVLPAAFISGIQFPLLVALLGRGRRDVGRHVGLTYAFNTVGSIAGSLAGGFGLLPAIGAVGAWRLAAGTSAALGVGAAVIAVYRDRKFLSQLASFGVASATAAMLFTVGPTAGWRHSGIGAGRAILGNSSVNGLRKWVQEHNYALKWEADGLESSVGLTRDTGLAFLVNGKADGHSTNDGGTQVMSGILGAILHPNPRKALVIGLGTGSTAGWLASVPSIDRVDVAEIEPAILRVAQECAPVNQRALENPKLHVILGDAREIMLTARGSYDLIFSEPSNPYRAGISSMYTREYYVAARNRLAEGGVFLQWLQAYEVDAFTVRTVLATLSSEFPVVSIWRTTSGDMILVATRQPISLDAAALRERIKNDPISTALRLTWRAIDLEGVLAHFVAASPLVRRVADAEEGRLNTDDQTLVEFGFARSVGRDGLFSFGELSEVARAMGAYRPEETIGDINWDSVDEQRHFWFKTPDSRLPEDTKRRLGVLFDIARGDMRQAYRSYRQIKPFETRGLAELEMVSFLLAEVADPGTPAILAKLREFNPVEADALQAILSARQGDIAGAVRFAEAFLGGLRSAPWQSPAIVSRAFALIASLTQSDPVVGRRVYDLLRTPFAVSAFEPLRVRTLLSLAFGLDRGSRCAEALAVVEPYVPWNKRFLMERFACYERVKHPLAARARADLIEFVSAAAVPFGLGLIPDEPEGSATRLAPQESATSTPEQVKRQ